MRGLSHVHTPQLGPPKRTPTDRFDLPSKSRFTSNTWKRSGRLGEGGHRA